MHVIQHLMRNLHWQSFSDKEIAGQARNDVLNNMMSVWYNFPLINRYKDTVYLINSKCKEKEFLRLLV